MWGVPGASPKIKICGVTRLEDALLAAELGAWAVGLNFWRGTPRRVDADTAAEIAAALKRRTEVVGLFVNPTLDEVAKTADAVGLTMLQLHGDEGPAFCAEAGRRTGCRVIKAVRVRSEADVRALGAFHTDFHLLDAHVEGLRGGTGEPFYWALARSHLGTAPVIVGGGLTAENVGQAIAATAPFAVDVASGVEAEPGIKDPERMRAFVTAVAAAAEAQAGSAIA
jgi:phosphoribosylanthranilate isomerase